MKHLKLLMLAIVTTIIAWVTYASAPRGGVFTNPDGTSDNWVQAEMHEALNNYRESLWVPKLIWNSTLTKTANKYACRMAANNFFGHVQPNGDDPFKRADAMWYFSDPVWENILYAPAGRNNWTPGENTLALRKSSPSHLSTMTQAGRTDVWMWYCSWYRVQMFGVNEDQLKMRTMPMCSYGIMENSIDVRLKQGRTWPNDCIQEGEAYTKVNQVPTKREDLPVIKKAMKDIPTTATTTSLTKKQQALLVRLNKLYLKQLGWKKLYIK